MLAQALMLDTLANSTDLSMAVLPLGGFVWSFCHPGPSSCCSLKMSSGLECTPPPPPRTPHQAAGVLWHHVSVEVSLSIIQGPVTGPSEIHRYSLKWHQAQSGICFLCSWKHTQDSEVKHLLPSELFTDLPMDLSVTSNWQGNKPCGRDTSASQAEDTEPEKDFLCCW